MKHRAALLLAVVIVLYIVVARASARQYAAALDGLWAADADFLDAAGLREALLFVGPAGAWGRRRGYFLATAPDGRAVANTGLDIAARFGPRAAASWFSGRAACVAPFRIRPDAAIPASVALPLAGSLAVSARDGSLALGGAGAVAVFAKDSAATPDALAAFAAGDPADPADPADPDDAA